MKSHRKVLPVAGALFLLTAFCLPLSGQTSLTIYNDGRVLVRRSIAMEVARGSSTVQVAVGSLDPSTLFSLDSSVVVTGVSYDGAVDQASVLRRAIGKKLKVRMGGPADTFSVTVLGVDPERYLMPDGTISFSMPGTPYYPAELVVIDPVATMNLRSSAARTTLRLGYFTAGASWQANYEVILGRTTATVQGDATISNDRLRLENAELQLLAGSVSSGGGRKEADGGVVMARAAAEFGNATEQRVGEFHLYSLPGKTTLLPGITSSIALFDPVQAPYEKNYVVRGALPWYGMLPQYPDPQDVPVEVTYTVKRPRASEFGNRPLPGGTARLYQPDSSARLQLVGEAAIDHTPAGEDLRLFAGTAFDITAKRVQTTYTTRRDSLHTWATADYSVTISNATDSVVTVDVLEQRPGEWSVLSSSVPGTRLSSSTTRFRATVPARGETVVTYRVRVKW
ncbi:MAG TPA: hypothetical protein VGP80_04750 [Gemmatimonadales bacterium]|jgi:hypothetical protein|nr:hypothetical protein [Gemmatimonadales bacterium]